MSANPNRIKYKVFDRSPSVAHQTYTSWDKSSIRFIHLEVTNYNKSLCSTQCKVAAAVLSTMYGLYITLVFSFFLCCLGIRLFGEHRTSVHKGILPLWIYRLTWVCVRISVMCVSSFGAGELGITILGGDLCICLVMLLGHSFSDRRRRRTSQGIRKDCEVVWV